MVKKHLVLFILFCVCFPLFLAAQRQEETQEIANKSTSIHYIEGKPYYFHAVLPGQTLYSIARAYEVDQASIERENPDIVDVLRFDQIIRIPAWETLEEKEVADTLDQGNYFLYKISPGETKYGISRQFGLSIEDLESLNPFIREGLQFGHEIRLPRLIGSSLPVVQERVQEKQLPDTLEETYVFIPPQPRVHEPVWDNPDCENGGDVGPFDVALLIPLYLEQLPDNEGISSDGAETGAVFPSDRDGALPKEFRNLPPNHPSFAFISYYQGVMIALDSIRQQGVRINLHVFDVCQDERKARRLMFDGSLDGMDLLIGPFHRQPLDIISDYGRRNQIPMVSPLLAERSQLLGNPLLFKATPSMEAMLRDLAGYIAHRYPQQNIILLHNNQPGAARLISGFQDTLSYRMARMNQAYDSLNLARVGGYYYDQALVGGRRTNVPVMPDSVFFDRSPSQPSVVRRPENIKEYIFTSDGIDGLNRLLRPDRKNILVTLIAGEPFLSDYLRQLHQKRRQYDISIFGIPGWEDYGSIEIDYLQNLNVHIFTPDFVDHSDPHIRSFVDNYRKVFATEPNMEAIKGVQTAHFFFSALAKYGTNFPDCISRMSSSGPQVPFVFERSMGAGSGWENQYLSIFRIENYRRIDVTRPQVLEIIQAEMQ